MTIEQAASKSISNHQKKEKRNRARKETMNFHWHKHDFQHEDILAECGLNQTMMGFRQLTGGLLAASESLHGFNEKYGMSVGYH